MNLVAAYEEATLMNDADFDAGGSPARKRARTDDEEDTCAICISSLQGCMPGGRGECSAKPVSRLACGHRFHQSCVEKWLNRNVSCPVCRYNIRPAVKVTIRGLVIEVPWRKRHLTCAQAILEAMETFKTQHPHFVFRFPFLPACSFAELPCLSGMAWYGRHTFVDEVLKDADGSPLLEVRTASARHPNAIPSDAFAYARLLLKQPLKPRWASPRGVDPYYMRTDNWLETSIAAHQNGECRWSRKRRVLELEALLAHDEYDDPFEGEYTDDDAWGARRAQHVQLLQAVQAYEDGESGVRELFNKKEGPLEGPIGRTHVRLPPSRDTEAERASILRDALADLPLQFYGCPSRMECDGVMEFLRHMMAAAGVIADVHPSDKPAGLALAPAMVHVEVSTEHGMTFADCQRLMLEKWETFVLQVDKPIMCTNVPGEGMMFVINSQATDAKGKLPVMLPDECFIPVPGASFVDEVGLAFK